MKRRQFGRTAGVAGASLTLGGCTQIRSDRGDAGEADDVGDPDVSVTVVRNVPENPGPYEDPGGTATPQESDALALNGIVFQRAGDKGLVVAGNAVNTGSSELSGVTVEVTLYDETQGDTSERVNGRTERGSLGIGEAWEWAVTFGEKPEFEVNYYSVEATANYG
jgi:hypothetical protein